MGSVKVTVFGRIKPRQKNVLSQDYKLKYGDHEDQITFPASKATGRKVFRFKKIFGEDASQKQVFEAVAKPVIKNVFEGYNGTIFTYGQTGSGKTHTMTGSLEDWVDTGLIPRTVQEVFQMKERDTVVSITYFEIYNEHVYDLIRADRTDSEASQDYEEPSTITSFRNLSVHIVRSACEALLLYRRGDANKMVAETSSNARSSRSHVIFSIGFEFPHPKEEMISLKPVLYLVDLAGSEKITKCKTPMANPWETRYINLSLHYLEQVLVALRQPGRVHIPYRNSLMTALLRNSLGGNCITAMVATFSVSVHDIEETMQTCRFAERIALIKNDVKLSELTSPQKEIDSLKKENERLKTQIKLMGNEQILDHLTTKDKEKCNEMVQNFLRDNDFFALPLTDIRRMEFCFYLMRNEILRKKSQALVKVDSKDTDGIKMIESSLWSLHEGQQNNNSSSTCNKSISNNSTSNNSTPNNSNCNNDITSNTSTTDATCFNETDNDVNNILANNKNINNNSNVNINSNNSNSNNSNSNTTSSNINVAEKNPRRKRNPLELPKVNITYKRWKSTEQLPEKGSSTKKQVAKVQQPGKKDSKNSVILQNEVPFEEPKVSAEYVQEKDYGITARPRSSNFLKLSGESETRDINLINVSSSHNIEAHEFPNTIFIEINGKGIGNFLLEDPSAPSDIYVGIDEREQKTNLYVEDLSYPVMGLSTEVETNAVVQNCKALKGGSLHRQVEMVQTHDIAIYKEPQIEILHQPKSVFKDDREKNTKAKDDDLHRPTDQFSAICVPLTGDQEVDEEILKFYKLRYEIFKDVTKVARLQ